MAYTSRPIAPGSHPEGARSAKEEGPKTFVTGDTSDMEDSLPWWRALTLFGVLLLVVTDVLWSSFPGSTLTLGARLPLSIIGTVALLVLSGMATAVLSFGQESIAFFAAAAILFFDAIALPSSVIDKGFASSVNGFAILGVMFALGTLLAVGGAIGLIRVYRAISSENQAEPEPASGTTVRDRDI